MRLIAAIICLCPMLAFGGVYERVIYYCHTNGVDNPSFQLRDDGQGVYIWHWDVALPKPEIGGLPGNAASMSFVSTAEQFQVVGIVSDTNTIRQIRQNLQACRDAIVTTRANVNTNSAFTNPQQNILKDILSEIQELRKAQSQILKESN